MQKPKDMAMPLRDEGVTLIDCPVEAVDDHIILVKEEGVNKVGRITVSARQAEKSRPFIGEIKSVGPSAPVYLKGGQRIIYQEYGETTIYPYGIEYVAIRARDVICILKENPMEIADGQRTTEETEGSRETTGGDETEEGRGTDQEEG